MHCFIVTPIGEPDSSARKRSNGFLREVLKPVAQSKGYTDVERADHDKSPGVVTEAIVEKLVTADLVIADLHGHNPNVMYEVAIRHATGRPIVQMIPHGESLPFDIGGLNTIFYDPSVDGLEKWRSDLAKAIDALQTGDSAGANPVSRASLFRALRESNLDQAQVLSALVDTVDQLRLEVRAGSTRGHSRSSRGSRVLLPASKYVEAEVSQFLQQHPALSDLYFMVDGRDQNLHLTVLPEGLGAPLANLEYPFDWDDEGRIPVDEIKSAILDDLLRIMREQTPLDLFEEPGETDVG